jgi:hypothetical protein
MCRGFCIQYSSSTTRGWMRRGSASRLATVLVKTFRWILDPGVRVVQRSNRLRPEGGCPVRAA